MSKHVVVDGSNLATEGRALPSLKQLNEATAAYRAEHPDHVLIVVADATFGHRIDPSEVGEFDAMVETGQIVCPPAGAVGRGDAFVLTIADKADALILSNDSFQEFHGTYPWLFDENRLMGGKPVPFIGWVFVYRTPVRGPLSRKSVQVAKRRGRTGQAAAAELAAGRVSKEAMAPMPVPKLPPPRARKVQQSPATPAKGHSETPVATPAKPQGATAAASNGAPQPPRHGPINDLLPFLEFVEKHPVGSTVEAVIESFSSHGAYAMAGPVRVYLPLRLMAEPAPRSAREMVKIGESRTVSVSSFNAGRRGVDVSLLGVVASAGASAGAGSGRSRGSRKRGGGTSADVVAPVESTTVVETVAAKTVEKSTKRGRGRAAVAPATVPTVEAADAGPDLKAAGSKTSTRKAASASVATPKSPAPEAPTAKVAATKRGAKKAAPAKSPASKPAVAKLAATKVAETPVAKKSRKASKQVVDPVAAAPLVKATKAAKSPAKKAAVEKAPAKKTAAKKAAATKSPAAKTPEKKTPETKAPETKALATKNAAKKAVIAKKAPAAPLSVAMPPTMDRSSRPRTNPAR
ncbi:MAG: hypothetical protein AB7V43_08135 [Acidimicrobiia bacterium]